MGGRMMKKLILLMLVLFMFVLTGCGKLKEMNIIDTQKEMNTIYIALPSAGEVCITDTYPIYRIDLANKSVSLGLVTYEDRDYSYDSIKYDLMKELTDEEINDFVNKCTKYGVADWKEKYSNPNICDGDYWYIEIVFADGTTKNMFGDNAFPRT